MKEEDIQTAVRYYKLAKEHNWDDDYEALYGILLDPGCDQGTALMIYWLGKPKYFCQFTDRMEVPSYNRENYDLLKMIEKKYRAYPKIISYDPKDDIVEYEDAEVKVPIDPIFYEPVKGIISQEELKKRIRGNI